MGIFPRYTLLLLTSDLLLIYLPMQPRHQIYRLNWNKRFKYIQTNFLLLLYSWHIVFPIKHYLWMSVDNWWNTIIIYMNWTSKHSFCGNYSFIFCLVCKHRPMNTIAYGVYRWDNRLEPKIKKLKTFKKLDLMLTCYINLWHYFVTISFSYLEFTGTLPLSSRSIPISSRPRLWVYGLRPTHTNNTSASN